MKKIESFNKPQIVQLRSEIDNALASVAKKYGITISAGNCSFSGNEANFKLSGYNTRARKAPINFTDSRGNGYKCSIAMLNQYNSK